MVLLSVSSATNSTLFSNCGINSHAVVKKSVNYRSDRCTEAKKSITMLIAMFLVEPVILNRKFVLARNSFFWPYSSMLNSERTLV